MKENYLECYKGTRSIDLYKGSAGFLRRTLDIRARRMLQQNRHALFFKRILDKNNITLYQKIRVLEIGCGDAKSISYSHPNIERHAIDKGETFRVELENRGIKFVCKDVDTANLKLPYEEGSFDIVLLNHIIEHIYNNESFMGEMGRILVRNGILYVRCPNVLRTKMEFYNDYTHIRPYTPASIEQIASAYGFTIKEMLHSNHSRIQLDILTNYKLSRLLFSRLFGGKEIEVTLVKGENL